MKKKDKDSGTEIYAEHWRSKGDLLDIYGNTSYIKTLIAMAKDGPLYGFLIKSLSFFRRFRLISYIALGISYIITLIGTGAILLVYLSIFSVILFFSLFFLLNFAIIAGVRRKKANDFFEDRLYHDQIYIFILTRRQKFKQNSFFASSIKELSKNGKNAVFVVTPRIYGKVGFDGAKRKSFITFRCEADNIYLLRSHYYFSFKKKILPKIMDRAVLVF